MASAPGGIRERAARWGGHHTYPGRPPPARAHRSGGDGLPTIRCKGPPGNPRWRRTWTRPTTAPTSSSSSRVSAFERFRLSPADRLLEVGCGGGAFMRRALESGCSATAIDHSPELVRPTGEVNRAALDAGRLVPIQTDAGRLPVAREAFTACVCTRVFNSFQPPPRCCARCTRRWPPAAGLRSSSSPRPLAALRPPPGPLLSDPAGTSRPRSRSSRAAQASRMSEWKNPISVPTRHRRSYRKRWPRIFRVVEGRCCSWRSRLPRCNALRADRAASEPPEGLEPSTC